jgi:hypothetical protein
VEVQATVKVKQKKAKVWQPSVDVEVGLSSACRMQVNTPPSLHLGGNLCAQALKPKALKIHSQLAELYPNPPIPLDHGSDFQLLCAVLLSAQVL